MVAFLRYFKKILYKGNAMPEALIFFITSKCNARCKHCFFWKDLNKINDEMTLDEISKFSSNLPAFSHLFISGGEPFLRNDLPEIVEQFYRNNKVRSISIPTNGLLTKKIVSDITKIFERNRKLKLVIDFSIDGLNERHDSIRGVKGLFSKVIESVNEIKILKKKYAGLNLGVICVFNSDNQNNIYEIYRFIKDEIRPDSVSFPLIRGNPKECSYKNVDIDKYGKFCSFLKAEYGSGSFKGYNSYPLSGFSNIVNLEVRKDVYKTAKLNRYLMPCYASELIGTIYSNGDVYCCELLPWKLGNLREANYRLDRIWFSKNAQRIKSMIKDKKCFCTHECFMHVNLLFNLKSLALLGADYLAYKSQKFLAKLSDFFS